MASNKKYQFAFSGKEIFIIVSMLIFISALIFTLGIIYGKTGGISLDMAKLSSEKLSDDDFENDDFDDEKTGDNLQEEDLDDDMDAFEGDKNNESSDLKNDEKVASKEKESEGKKEKSSKDTNLSFYKDLTNNDKSIDKAPTKKSNKYPMISEEVLMSNKGKYTVQVAAYAKEVDAESKTLLLKKLCCSSAYYVESEVPGKGVWYQVRIGFFDKLLNAKTFAKNLKDKKKIAEYVIKIVR